MRWSAWVGVAVVVVVALGGTEAASRTTLVNQGYEEVVVGLSPLLDERQAEDIITALKKAVNETSQALFKATGNRLFLRKVKILIPSTWTNVTVNQPASSETFDSSDLRVDLRNPVYGDQVYTVQPGACGDPGKYIHITPDYLTEENEHLWGPKGKVLAQAWARLRWGVFDELGYPGDEVFPLFYRSWNELQEVVVRPNHCADEKISGSFVDWTTGGSCRYVDGLPDDNCRFRPDDQQAATTSLMSFTTLDSIEKFCIGESEAAVSHNAEAPNRHNLMCDRRSVGDVIADHPDFFNTTKLELGGVPEVVVVQEVSAKFALVLDYSGSMEGKKIKNLANTAKRWILHDVADGSFVAIIKFSTTATVLKTLTKISNNTRQELANAITDQASGSTCIGCGLLKALGELKDKANSVIMLISDGEETSAPYIKDVMADVVESGVRVVSIAYGIKAEETMETLAQNTGGKAYIVPEDDDGTFMNDAFQGSLTYQPGQSITNIDIKIHEETVTLNGTEAKGTFIVDSTLGRNLEFRLDTAQTTQSSAPYLISPTGQNHTNAEVTSTLNLWIIKVDSAENGTWTWMMPVNRPSSSAIATVTVTAQAKDPETLPIYTESWMNTGVDYVNASYQPVIVYAKVTQGSKPVVGAKVRAYITTPDTTAAAIELDLLDNGKNADVQKGDGTYSRYFTQFNSDGRYAVKAQVWDEGSSYINNGFIVSRRRRSLSVPLALTRLAASYQQLEVPDYCCGSVVPFDPDTATRTGEFTRTAAAGSFNVVEMPIGGDAFPPSRVGDLSSSVEDTATLTLNWTAPGDDYDFGTVSGYEIWMSDKWSSLTGDVNNNSTISLLDFEESSNMTEILKPFGEEVTLKLTLEEPLEEGTLYFVALKAVDDVGSRSPMSNIARVSAPVSSTDGGLEGWAIALIVIGCIAGVVLLVGAGYFIYKKSVQ